MTGGPYDPRAVANLMLEEADRSGIKVTNLALQKLLYFAHSIFLIEAKRPLVSGYFEAWQYGPVHPTAYAAFKSAGSSPIDFRATGQNVMTGERTTLSLPEDLSVRRHLARIVSSYGQLSPGRLVWSAAGFVDTEIRCLTELESGNAEKEVQPRVQA